MRASLPFSFSFGPKLLSSALLILLFFQNPYPSSSVLNSSFPKPPPPFIHAFDRISSLTHSLTHFLAWVLAWPTTDWQHVVVVVVAEDYIILLPSSFSSTALLGTSQVQLHQDSITTSKFSLIVLFPWVVYSLSLSLSSLSSLYGSMRSCVLLRVSINELQVWQYSVLMHDIVFLEYPWSSLI